MSELNEPQWAVLSERGCEAAGLSYEEAAEIARNLARKKVYGLCIITNEAAHRLSHKGAISSTTVPQPAEAQSKL